MLYADLLRAVKAGRLAKDHPSRAHFAAYMNRSASQFSSKNRAIAPLRGEDISGCDPQKTSIASWRLNHRASSNSFGSTVIFVLVAVARQPNIKELG